ncbi:MAG: hypothetical protein JXA36_00505 [Coriobacteriia bacterium]|nr:hypothetical protein [Coriobacteriia bacterium]
MIFVALAALAGSALMSYAIGYAFIAPRDAFVRSKRGVLLIVVGGLSLIFLPPQVTGLDAVGGTVAATYGLSGAFNWPESLSKGAYLVVWGVTSIVALLAGMRIWAAGSPDWRAGSRAYDASAASRVNSLLPLADTLPDALDVLARAGMSERDVGRAAGDIREAGRRLADALPPSDGALYAMAAAKMPAGLAGPVTGYLLEGAGRRAGVRG